MRIFARTIALIMLLVAVPGAFAEDFRDIANRFTLTAPPGWKRVSDADLKKFEDFAAQQVPDRNFNYVAAFTKKIKTPFDVPYVVVQITHVRLKGENYEGLEKSLGSGKFQKASDDAALKLSNLITDFKVDQPVVDKVHNRMFSQLSMTDPRGKQIKAVCTANFGDESIVQINCYADAAKLDASLPEFEAFNDGFQFDSGAEFHPVPRSIWSGPAGTGLIGGIVGGLVGLLSVVFKKIRGS